MSIYLFCPARFCLTRQKQEFVYSFFINATGIFSTGGVSNLTKPNYGSIYLSDWLDSILPDNNRNSCISISVLYLFSPALDS